MRRVLKPLVAVAGIALLAGCSAPDQPQVTFYSHGDAVRASPLRYCNVHGRSCTKPQPQAVEDLAVPPRAPLQISVPEEVTSAPWQIVFRYRTPDGQEHKGRSPVFGRGKRHAYTLRLPVPGAQLVRVEVQRYAGGLTVGPQGNLLFPIGGSWALDVHPEDRPTGNRAKS